MLIANSYESLFEENFFYCFQFSTIFHTVFELKVVSTPLGPGDLMHPWLERDERVKMLSLSIPNSKSKH